MTVVDFKLKPKLRLVLKPHERQRAIERGLLKEPAQEAAKAEKPPPPHPRPDRPATGRGQAAPRLPRPLAILAAAFGVETIRIPLAIGCGEAMLPGVGPGVRKAFRSIAYQKALATSPHRYHPDGTVASEVSEQDRAGAIKALAHYAEQSANKAQTRKKED